MPKGTKTKGNMELGRWMSRLRQDKGMSQEELGAAVGVHRNSIGRYEAGFGMPVAVFVELCAVLGVKPEKLLGKAEKHGK